MNPITRKEMFMAKAAGQSVNCPAPITREEMFLSQIGSGGGGGGASNSPLPYLTLLLADDGNDERWGASGLKLFDFNMADGTLTPLSFMDVMMKYVEAGITNVFCGINPTYSIAWGRYEMEGDTYKHKWSYALPNPTISCEDNGTMRITSIELQSWDYNDQPDVKKSVQIDQNGVRYVGVWARGENGWAPVYEISPQQPD